MIVLELFSRYWLRSCAVKELWWLHGETILGAPKYLLGAPKLQFS